MKILTMGDPSRINPLLLFRCLACGCEFVANASECARHLDQYNETMYSHVCPCCKRQTYSGTEYDRNRKG